VDERASAVEPLRFEIRINATRDEIFPYLTESSLITQWLFGHSAELLPEPGGAFVVNTDEMQVRGEFLAVEPPQRVSVTWGIVGNAELPAGSTTVEITLTAEGDGTLVQLLHHDVPESRRKDHSDGWVACLDRLSRVAVHSTR
jgi:uncharacterized protein YndB with AHSA1/START domain